MFKIGDCVTRKGGSVPFYWKITDNDKSEVYDIKTDELIYNSPIGLLYWNSNPDYWVNYNLVSENYQRAVV